MKTALKFLTIFYFFALILFACSSGNDNGDQPMEPTEKQTIYESNLFTMYLPKNVNEVKGVIFFLTGGSGDSRPWVRGDVTSPPEAVLGRQQIVQIMESYNLVLIGNESSHYSEASPYQSMLSALQAFANASDHPELAFAPLLPFGYSTGGRAALNFAFNYPERTVGVYVYKGDISNISDQSWEIIRNIPTFLHMGELDTNVGSTIPYQFGLNREEGALWGAGIEKGVAHEFNPPFEFITDWMKASAISRIPNSITSNSTPVLKEIMKESGWLGDHDTFNIMTYNEFQGDLGSASWLYNEETAEGWKSIFE
ncbi:alpha/beta hydrolase [Sabulilitoribacter multivorans]|uniref:Alpha/beta hydrolase n=1 Tax=Flaviramulus multivorans TaxID=1304750 RepID=A0ABS9IGX3_9FLAO|nr:alpha/beta hydrolase [Flaviramulus multivorans]MCF7560014.1 alpha/beta hydrolase [Flaviramulus multivorans]